LPAHRRTGVGTEMTSFRSPANCRTACPRSRAATSPSGTSADPLEYYSKIAEGWHYDLYESETSCKDPRRCTRILTERANEFIEHDHRQPWLSNLGFGTPHWPWTAEGDTEEVARMEGLLREVPPEQTTYVLARTDGGCLDTYREMVEGMDRSIGEAMRTLEESGQADDTLIVSRHPTSAGTAEQHMRSVKAEAHTRRARRRAASDVVLGSRQRTRLPKRKWTITKTLTRGEERERSSRCR
jgi:hypothetical protein